MTVQDIVEEHEAQLQNLNDWYERVFAVIVANDRIPAEMVNKLNRVNERRKAAIHANFVRCIEQM